MTSQQLDEEAIFHVARGIPDLELRSLYLRQICAGDQALRDRVAARARGARTIAGVPEIQPAATGPYC